MLLVVDAPENALVVPCSHLYSYFKLVGIQPSTAASKSFSIFQSYIIRFDRRKLFLNISKLYLRAQNKLKPLKEEKRNECNCHEAS
jgi:hypothetical protein